MLYFVTDSTTFKTESYRAVDGNKKTKHATESLHLTRVRAKSRTKDETFCFLNFFVLIFHVKLGLAFIVLYVLVKLFEVWCIRTPVFLL